MKSNIIFLSLAITIIIFLSGCLEENVIESKISFTEIRIGDMPTDDFSHINVTFSEVKLHSNETGWQSILSEPKIVDLIYLHVNNITEQLGLEEINIGNYTKLWIVVDNATGVLKSTNETVVFEVPSNTLKIQQLFKLDEGNNTITIDIDLENSILVRGDKYKILPVISGIDTDYANGSKVRIRDKNKIKNMIENRPPVVDVIANGTRGKPIKVNVDENITFNASGTYDVDGNNLTYFWDFGDGTNATGSVAIHYYVDKGSYWVTLTVSDGQEESSEQIHITVK